MATVIIPDFQVETPEDPEQLARAICGVADHISGSMVQTSKNHALLLGDEVEEMIKTTARTAAHNAMAIAKQMQENGLDWIPIWEELHKRVTIRHPNNEEPEKP